MGAVTACVDTAAAALEIIDRALLSETSGAEVKRLCGVALQLPDGTPIVPGVKVFFWSYCTPKHLMQHAIQTVLWSRGGVWLTFDDSLGRSPEECFGTAEAAERGE